MKQQPVDAKKVGPEGGSEVKRFLRYFASILDAGWCKKLSAGWREDSLADRTLRF